MLLLKVVFCVFAGGMSGTILFFSQELPSVCRPICMLNVGNKVRTAPNSTLEELGGGEEPPFCLRK